MKRETQNLNVIKALMKGERKATLLKGYTGWGGLKEAIYTPGVYKELKNYLSDNEIALIKKTMGNAYYTPAFIVKAMYRYLQSRGFAGGQILEPAAGTGVFIEHMPESIRKNSEIVAVELEPVSARILAGLYPDIKVKNCGFETLDKSTKFDLIIGNPPYGKEKLKDEQHLDLQELAIHHYFAAKSMRLLKEGGILAMVLPSFFMDNYKEHARAIIAQEGGRLLDAFRLPDNCFESAKVTVDLIFLQKGGNVKNCDWVNTDRITVNQENFRINQYFNKNRKHILGKLSWVGAYGRKQLNCVAEDQDLPARLSQAIQTGRVNSLPVSAKIDFEHSLQIVRDKLTQLQTAKEKLTAMQNDYTVLMQQIQQIVV